MTHDDQPSGSANLDEFLCFAVYAASHAFTRFYKPILDAFGITYPQYLTLVALGEDANRETGMTVSELSTRLLLESSTLTPMLKRLETASFVSRRRESQDERIVRVRLTEHGVALLGKTRALPSCVASTLGRPYHELSAMKEDIDALRVALCQPNAGKEFVVPA